MEENDFGFSKSYSRAILKSMCVGIRFEVQDFPHDVPRSHQRFYSFI